LFFFENLSLSYNQIIHIPCRVRDIVGHPSGTERHISCLFEDSHLCIRFVPLGSACRTHARRVTANDDELHKDTSKEKISW